MKTLIKFILLFGFCTLSFSQTSKHLEIIEIEEKNQIPLLLDDSVLANNSSFDSVNYSTELQNQTKNFNMRFRVSNNFSSNNDWGTISLNNFKKEAFTNFEISYKRSELKRLLPTAPNAFNFCPDFGQ